IRVGLGQPEAKTYLALVRLQEAQSGALCNETNITSSNIYYILDSLMKKGLASYRLQNNIKIFMPSTPDALNEFFISKQKKLEEERLQINTLISTLKKQPLEKEPDSNYKYFEGIQGVKSLWYEINENMNNSDTFRLCTSKRIGYERLITFYDEHHLLRSKKKILAKIIYPLEDKQQGKKRGNELTKIRYMNIQNEAEWGTINDYFYIQYITGKRPRAFLIKDKTFANCFKETFDRVWESAKEKNN
ncbi:MAG: helix-turn-helix domain-containing protein, partial [archaeon]